MSTTVYPTVEEHARRTERLHPAVIEVLQPHFDGFDLSDVPVHIHTACWFRSTPCLVNSGTIHFPKGVLNTGKRWEKGNYQGVYFDLSRPGGMAKLGHEILHVRQWHVNPLRIIRENLNAVTRVVLRNDRDEWWESPFEQEAIRFEQTLTKYFTGQPSQLGRFLDLR